MAEAFIPNPSNLEQVDHINNSRTDNRKSNLRWVSRKFNNSRPHARKMKRLNSRHTARSHLAVRGESGGVVRYFKTARHASNEIGCPHPSVIKVLRGDFKQTHGWKFKYVPRDSEEVRAAGLNFETDWGRRLRKAREKVAQRKQMRKGLNAAERRALRVIVQLDMDGTVVAEWAYPSVAARTLGIANIFSCLLGKVKSAGGFMWKYKCDMEG